MKKVEYVKLHSTLFVPGPLGNLKDTLTGRGDVSKSIDWELFELDNGSVLVRYKQSGQSREAVIGAANVQILVRSFVPEETTPPEETKAPEETKPPQIVKVSVKK